MFDRDNPTADEEEELSVDKSVIDTSRFDDTKKTKFVVHGWTHSAHRKWVQDMVAELLKNVRLVGRGRKIIV